MAAYGKYMYLKRGAKKVSNCIKAYGKYMYQYRAAAGSKYLHEGCYLPYCDCKYTLATYYIPFTG